VKAAQNPCLFQQEVSAENTWDSQRSLKSRNFTWQQALQPEPSTELQLLVVNICTGEREKK